MFDFWKKVQTVRFGGSLLESGFHFRFPSRFQWLSPGASTLPCHMQMRWLTLPHLTPISRRSIKRSRCSSQDPQVQRWQTWSGEEKKRKTLAGRRAGGRKESDGKERRAWSLGQGEGMFSVNLHLVCYRWYRPPRTVICLGFPKQRWTGTPAYTGLFCLQLLESLLSVYYHRLPWVWWSQSRNTCPEFYSHIRWTPA